MDEYCKEHNFAGWFETSAKENINIDEAAKSLVTKVCSCSLTMYYIPEYYYNTSQNLCFYLFLDYYVLYYPFRYLKFLFKTKLFKTHFF